MAVAEDFARDHQVFEPHKTGLPPLRTYLGEMWKRRQFAVELARTQLKAQHANTVFGQLWLLLNPILLGIVYYMLVTIVRGGSRGPEFFAHLLGGLFLFYFINWSMSGAAKSVVGGGRLILNTAFPRVLLPLASVQSAFRRFLPALVPYAFIHWAMGMPFTWHLLWVVPIVMIIGLVAIGGSLLVAAAQVYFRDLKNVLPYSLRMWMYASPVIWYASDVPDAYDWLLTINPIASTMTAWSDIREGVAPQIHHLLMGAGWGIAILVIGWIVFVSREREFAVRL